MGEKSMEATFKDFKKDPHYISVLMLAVAELVDDVEQKINDGISSPLNNECVLISTIDRVYHKLLNLRKCSNKLDLVLTNSKLKDSGMAGNSQDSMEFLENSIDGYYKSDLSEKITCVCTICEERISFYRNDVEYAMNEHVRSFHSSVFRPDLNDVNCAENWYNVSNGVNGSKSESESEILSGNETNNLPPLIASVISEETKSVFDDSKSTSAEVITTKNVLELIKFSNGICSIKNGKHICYLCNAFLPLQRAVYYHNKSRSHRQWVEKYIEMSEEVKKNHLVSVDPNIFVVSEGLLFCQECKIFFLSQHQFLRHVSEKHEQKLKLEFSYMEVGEFGFCTLCDVRVKGSSSEKKETHVSSRKHCIKYLELTTIVQIGSTKFCSVCFVKLSTESEYDSHLVDDAHISNVADIHRILGSGKKKLF